MSAGVRLGLFGLAVVVAFVAAYLIAGAVVPQSALEGWALSN
ncbi:hypothetical protein V5R04_08415 [Jonesiaceae bacterium BS-20]|uniref:Uncharacterized protein n=1 Tax=Jonesiaceae bacterium BS-20 TaxID=3120821 RepID=A0AAU7DRH2_9MICO